MISRGVVAVGVTVLAVALSAGAEAAKPSFHTPCNPSGTRPVFVRGEIQRIVGANRTVRVFEMEERDPDDVPSLYACLRGSRGRAFPLRGGPLYDRAKPGRYGDFGLQMAGSMVSYGSVGDNCNRQGCDGPKVSVFDVKRRLERREFGVVQHVLRRDGSIVAIVSPFYRKQQTAVDENDGSRPGPGPFDVRLIWRGGEALISGGGDIDPSSLAVAGDRAYWTENGQPVSRILPR